MSHGLQNELESKRMDWRILWEKAKTWHDEGRRFALATVIRTWGSAPRPVGSHMIIDQDGNIEGSVSGGCVEGAVIAAAEDVIASGKSQHLDFNVTSETAWDVGLPCGGRIEILVEPYAPKHVLAEILSQKLTGPSILITDMTSGEFYFCHDDIQIGEQGLADGFDDIPDKSGLYENIFIQHYLEPVKLIVIGAVHISQALVEMAKVMDIPVMVIDPRQTFATKERFPDVKMSHDWPDEALTEIDITRSTAVVTLTHDAKLDDLALEKALNSDAFYIASLGSRKTHAARVGRLEKMGFSEDDIARVHGPAGLNIGGLTPAEIALSILAEMVSLYRKDHIK